MFMSAAKMSHVTGVCTISAPCTQNFSTYTYVNPSGYLSNTTTAITFTNLTRDNATYAYNDFGAGYWNNAWTALSTFKMTSISTASYAHLSVFSNQLNVFGSLTNGASIQITALGSSTTTYGLRVLDIGQLSASATYTASVGTTYYLKLVHDPNAGANGTATLTIYSDAARTVQLFSGSVVGNASSGLTSSRYVYGVMANSGGGGSFTGTIQDMSIYH